MTGSAVNDYRRRDRARVAAGPRREEDTCERYVRQDAKNPPDRRATLAAKRKETDPFVCSTLRAVPAKGDCPFPRRKMLKMLKFF